MELDLKRMRQGLSLLNLTIPAFPSVQVVGSNGKGSVSTFLEALARKHGLKTGLFTSPHFLSPRERILINGKKLERSKWLEAAQILHGRVLGTVSPTYFEFLTLLAMRLFSEERVDFAIFEAGLGGLHDATSALNSQFCCFTPIALDHAAIIGPSLQDIAMDKAGALKGKLQAWSSPQYPIAARILSEAAESLAVPLHFTNAQKDPALEKLSLKGRHQIINASLALSAWRGIAASLDLNANAEAEKAAIANAFIAGRLQHIAASDAHPAFILDGAHNPHAFSSLVRELPEISCIIFSALSDKAWRDSLGLLCRKRESPVLVPQIENKRAENPRTISDWLNRQSPGRARPICGHFSMLRALAEGAKISNGKPAPLLVCGSLFLLSAFYSLFPQYLNKNGDDNDNASRA